MDLKTNVDFSDVEAYFSDGKVEVDMSMADSGEKAGAYAAEHGNYQDHTGTLRKSNKFEVEEDRLKLFNDATSPNGYQYAAKVESKGYDVLSGAALEAERDLKQKFER